MSDCFVLYLLLTCMKKKTSGADKFTNNNMRSADPYYANNRLEIHEIEPVKMGGSPTDINNKTAIQSQVHRRYVTLWWNKIRDEVKKGLD